MSDPGSRSSDAVWAGDPDSEAPARQDARYRLIVETAPDAILLVTSRGSIDFANQEAERLFGYPRAELLGQSIEILVPPASRAEHPQHRAAFAADPRTRSMGQGKTLRVHCKDGSELLADISLAPVATEAGPMTSVVVRDVTDQRKLEARVEAVQRMEAIGRLAGGVAHEFNNMLTVIVNFSTFALEALDPTSGAADDVREVLSASERAKNLTEKLLTFSRKKRIEPRLVNLSETLDAIDRMLRRLLGDDIVYETTLEEGLWPAWVDPSAIEQVVVNLALNARDAMRVGGRLTLETSNVTLDERSVQAHGGDVPAGQYVVITVTDSGHGMDAETRARIFEPFFTTKGDALGTGLGLSTSYGIVKQAGGYLCVESAPGRGSTFRVYLPPSHAEQERPHRAPAPVPPRGTETILVAEDENQVRALTVRTLRRLGYTVHEARTGREALKFFEAHRGPLDLLLSDVMMPEMTGTELVERVTPTRPQLKVLYMSGYTGEMLAREGALGGLSELLQKPFTPAVLAQRVRAALDD